MEFAALASTIAHLPEQSRTLLGKLSIFRFPFPLQTLEQGLRASEVDWKPLLDWALLRFDLVDEDYHLHSLTAHFAQGLLDATERVTTQVQIAEWYLRYGREESHELSDYLEAHRLLRAAGKVERAGELAIGLGEVLSRFGLYQLWSQLCRATINDAQNINESLVAQAQHQLGTIAQDQGEYEEARRLYGEVLSIFERLGDQSGRASTLHQLGLLAYQQHDYQAALQYTVHALTIFERLHSPSRDIALSELSKLKTELGESEFTLLWQNTMRGQSLPELPVFDHRQVLVDDLISFIQAETWTESQRLLEAHPEFLGTEADTLLEQLAAAQQDEGTRQLIEEHRALLTRCRSWGIEPTMYFTLGMCLGDSIEIPPEHEEAVRHIATLLSQQPANETALGRAIEAMQHLLHNLLTGVPPLFEAALLRDLADAMGRLPADHPARNLAQMETYYRKALTAYQSDDRPLGVHLIQREFASVLTEQGHYEEALEPLQAAIAGLQEYEQYKEQVPWALSEYASDLDNLGRSEEAIAVYAKAIALLPDASPLYRNRAETLIHAQRLDEAEADLAHAFQLDGNEDSPYLWYRRAQLAIARGDSLQAEQMLNEAVSRDASSDVVLLSAQVAWLLGDLQTAQESLQKVWEKANPGERSAMRRDMERLFNEHPELAGRDTLESIMH